MLFHMPWQADPRSREHFAYSRSEIAVFMFLKVSESSHSDDISTDSWPNHILKLSYVPKIRNLTIYSTAHKVEIRVNTKIENLEVNYL